MDGGRTLVSQPKKMGRRKRLRKRNGLQSELVGVVVLGYTTTPTSSTRAWH
jgi:hypothetical protein